MRSILILFAHPALEKSRVNRHLVEQVNDLEGVTFHDLYEAYPDLHIDVRREQALLTDHDVIVFHHPFFWYSTPAILKEWQDLVLEHGWAYGKAGTALEGKLMFSVITTGGGESAYQRDGFVGHTMGDLLVPISRTARLCRMEYLPPFITHGTLTMNPAEIEGHARDYRRVIEAFRDGHIQMDALGDVSRLNADLEKIIVTPRVTPRSDR